MHTWTSPRLGIRLIVTYGATFVGASNRNSHIRPILLSSLIILVRQVAYVSVRSSLRINRVSMFFKVD